MSLELLSLGVDFIGGLLGSKAKKREMQLYRDQMKQSQAQFDAQMDQSVQRRVQDAKAAGVHPLFALGASVGSSPTISAGQPPRAESPMGKALTNMASTLGVIEQNKARARKDEAEAALFDSERKRIEQELTGARGHDAQALSEVNVVPKVRGSVYGPAEYYSPQVAKSQRQGVAAGTHPGAIEYVTPSGDVYTLPSTDLNMDEISQVKYLLNEVNRYGRISRRKIEQVIQDVKQKRRNRARRRKPDDQYGYDVAP